MNLGVLCKAACGWRLGGSTAFSLCTFGGLLAHIRCNESDNCDAADIREPFAAFVSFQRIQPGHPLHKIVISAACSLTSACHFGGNYAKSAANATIITF